MAFLDEVALRLIATEAAGLPAVGAILSTASTDETLYLANDGSSNAIIALYSTAQAFYLAATSSQAELVASSSSAAWYLKDASPVWNIYKSHLPDSTQIGDRAVAVIETMGAGMMGRVELEMPGLQVLVRGAPQHTVTDAFSSAQSVAMRIHDALHEYTGSTDTTTHYLGVWCMDGPAFTGFDESWRPYFEANFRVMRATT